MIYLILLYYKFEINIKYYNKLPYNYVFLYISVKYSYNKTNNSYLNLTNNKYYLIISEGYEVSIIYLNKLKLISFIDIDRQEFIIKSNLVITFNNIF